MKRRLTRKQVAPRNVAAKALRLGQFQPKVAKDPAGYTRKLKHRRAEVPPGLEPDEDPAS